MIEEGGKRMAIIQNVWKVRYEREKKRADELEEMLCRLSNRLSFIQAKVSLVEQESEDLLRYLRTGDQGPALG
jgi:hypothetical protein